MFIGPDTMLSGVNSHKTCCSYLAAGMLGYDCVQIAGAVKESMTMTGANIPVKSNLCGRSAGLVTATGTKVNSKSICCKDLVKYLVINFPFVATLTPFKLNFRSDAFEYLAESMKADAGFRLGYTMDNTRCNQNTNMG